MAKKAMTDTAPKAAAKPKKPATPAAATRSTDALPDGNGAVSKTTKARATNVPPKAKSAGLAAPTARDVVAPMTTGVAAAISDDQIREHAYHLWLSGHPGGPENHWHIAERTLRNRK